MQRLPKISWESLLSRDFRPHLSMLCSALQYRQKRLQTLLLLKAVCHSPLQFEARSQHLEDVWLLGSVRVGTGAGTLPWEAAESPALPSQRGCSKSPDFSVTAGVSVQVFYVWWGELLWSKPLSFLPLPTRYLTSRSDVSQSAQTHPCKWNELKSRAREAHLMRAATGRLFSPCDCRRLTPKQNTL